MNRPILFSAPMVRALTAGTKTQTRRIVKLPADTASVVVDPGGTDVFGPGPYVKAYRRAEVDPPMHPRIRCPYGYPGDRLWVRESFCLRSREHHPEGGYWYAATDDVDNPRWTPSIHMPRAASRITLDVVAVRVERLHDISEADARAEGVEHVPAIRRWKNYAPRERESHGIGLTVTTARDSFLSLWEAINGTESLAANPWVWVVEFKRVEAARSEAA